MGCILGVLRPVCQIQSRVSETIGFKTEDAAGEEVLYRLKDLEARKMIEVDQMKLLRHCNQKRVTWRIQVVLDGSPTGLYLEPGHLVDYCRIIIFYSESVDDGRRLLCAGGIRKGSIEQLKVLRCLRNRKYKRYEQTTGVENIGEVQLHTSRIASSCENHEKVNVEDDTQLVDIIPEVIPLSVSHAPVVVPNAHSSQDVTLSMIPPSSTPQPLTVPLPSVLAPRSFSMSQSGQMLQVVSDQQTSLVLLISYSISVTQVMPTPQSTDLASGAISGSL